MLGQWSRFLINSYQYFPGSSVGRSAIDGSCRNGNPCFLLEFTRKASHYICYSYNRDLRGSRRLSRSSCCLSPLCQQFSQHVHSSYLRTMVDVPCGSRRALLHLTEIHQNGLRSLYDFLQHNLRSRLSISACSCLNQLLLLNCLLSKDASKHKRVEDCQLSLPKLFL